LFSNDKKHFLGLNDLIGPNFIHKKQTNGEEERSSCEKKGGVVMNFTPQQVSKVSHDID
jgi:hypothetical protein